MPKIKLKIGDLVRYIQDKPTRKFLDENLSEEDRLIDEISNIGIITKLFKLKALKDRTSEYAAVYWILENTVSWHLVINLELMSS